MAEIKVDIHKLKRMYESEPTARALFDNLASRQRDRRETAVDRLHASLVQGDVQISRGEIIEFFRELEKADCGKFLIGRRGHPSRFDWTVGLTSVAQAAAGKTTEVEAAPEIEQTASRGNNCLTHSYVLRASFVVRLDLPDDFSASEASRLAEFIKTLPFS